MKRLFTLLVSVILLYAGVAHALTACSVELGHPAHDETSHSTHSTALRQPDSNRHTHHRTSAVIHCLTHKHQIGPMIETGRVSTPRRFEIGVPLQKLVGSGEGILLSWSKDYHPKLFTYRPPIISNPVGSSFHAFLSVFRF